MTSASPVIVVLSRHAERRAAERRVDVRLVCELLLTNHAQRRRNPRHADWLLRADGVAIAYNWPDGGDAATALVVSVWRE